MAVARELLTEETASPPRDPQGPARVRGGTCAHLLRQPRDFRQ
jgi:hypothetical protein